MNRHNALLAAAAKLPHTVYKCGRGARFTTKTRYRSHRRLFCEDRPVPPVPRVNFTGVAVACLMCGAKFPNAIEMGLHQTREHFIAEYQTQKRDGTWVN